MKSKVLRTVGIIIWILYGISLFGIIQINPKYLVEMNTIIRTVISLVLMYRFRPEWAYNPKIEFGKDDWNFVFGMARAMDAVGVFSFARYTRGDSFPVAWKGCSDRAVAEYEGEWSSSSAVSAMRIDDEDISATKIRSSVLYRSAKVLAHETGHLFGIRHCIYYECLMCGCNHLKEFDKRPCRSSEP